MPKGRNRQKRKKKGSSSENRLCKSRAWEEEYGEKWKQQDVHSFGVDKRECMWSYET